MLGEARKRFFEAIGEPIENEDPSNRLLGMHTQLEWLRARLRRRGLLLEVARDGTPRRVKPSRDEMLC